MRQSRGSEFVKPKRKYKISITFIALLAGIYSSVGFPQSIDAVSKNGLAYSLVGEGQLLVFIHGSNLDRRMWADQLAWFKESAKVLSYDLRGLGDSETAVEKYSDHNDLIDLLDELEESSAVLIGLSAGVQVALDVATARPEIVRKLILVSPSLFGYVPRENPPYLAELIKALQTEDFDRANEVLLNSELMSSAPEYTDLIREMVNDSRQWILPYELIQQSSTPVIENLNNVNTLALILVGGNDLSAITELGTRLERELENARLITITDGNHLLNLSNPADFNRALDNFLGFD